MKYLLVVQLYGNLSITTATSEINETVESMSRFLTTNRNIELLEPYEGKLSRTVLRGERGSNALDLPDDAKDWMSEQFQTCHIHGSGFLLQSVWLSIARHM